MYINYINERRSLGNRNQNSLSMYEQREKTGYLIIVQKSKHYDSNIVERPSSPENVKHIVNAIELSLEETYIAKTGLIEDAKKALADQLRVEKESISDKTALQGIIFLNEYLSFTANSLKVGLNQILVTSQNIFIISFLSLSL